jgi:hypothetical protein
MSRRDPDARTVSTSLAPEVSPTAETVLDRANAVAPPPSQARDHAGQRGDRR